MEDIAVKTSGVNKGFGEGESRTEVLKEVNFANARIGVAKAAFFPTIKLKGAAGFASADLGTLVDWPSGFAQLDPTISVPVYQGGLNRANLANERYQRGLSSYLDVVDAQRAALQAERQDTQLRGQRAVTTIFLAKALGGGWEGVTCLGGK